MIRPLSTASGKTQAETTCGVSPFGADTAFFFLLAYLYVWLAVDPRLIHHSIGILTPYHPFSFHTGWGFFQEHWLRPGGLMEYAARFLTECYAVRWAGACIVTAAGWFGCWSADALGRLAGRPRGRVFRYVPAVLLMVSAGNYSHPLRALLSLVLALAAFLAYTRGAPHGLWKRLVTLLPASAVLYHVAGAGSLLLPAMIGIYELLARRPGIAGAAVLLGVAVPGIAGLLFSLRPREAFGGFLFSDPGVLPEQWPATLALYLFFPTLLVGAVVAQAVATRRASGTARRPRSKLDSSSVAKPERRPLPRWAREAVGMAAVLLAAGAVVWFSRDAFARVVLRIDYYSQREQWPEALAAARQLPDGTYNVRCHRNVMLALYHTERLGDAMFHYPQRPGVDLFSTPAEARDLGTDYQESRLFLALGQVNQAEKCVCETLETCGDLPAVLEELTLINAIKGRPETARLFVNALARHPFHRHAAGEMRARLDADPRLEDNSRVSAVRRNMVAKDDVALNTSIEDFLRALLETNPRNRMAFEFLMAHYLGTGRPDRMISHLTRLKDFSFRAVPRHYQEAVAICAATTGTPPVGPGYELDAAVFSRAAAFARILAGARSREDAAEAARTAGFGDSYFYYLAFVASGP